MSGAQFWAVAALTVTIIAITYLIGFRDGAEDERTRNDLSRRYS